MCDVKGEYLKPFSDFINSRYTLKFYESVIQDVVSDIEATILSTSCKEFLPYGLSVGCLLSDPKEPLIKTYVAHLDKSHIAIHTYPDINRMNGLCSYRTDIEISTCGSITPIHSMKSLIHKLDPDVMIMDYMIRGFTRNEKGDKLFCNEENFDENTILSHIPLQQYTHDVKKNQKGTYHLRFMKKEIQKENRRIGLVPVDEEQIVRWLFLEMNEIFSKVFI